MSGFDERFAAACECLTRIQSQRPDIGTKIQKEVARLLETLNEGSTGASEGQQQERHILEERLRGFVMEASRSYLFFQSRGWENCPFDNLKSIAEVFSRAANVPMDRDAKRRKPVLFRWFEDHWDELRPFAERLEIEWAGNDNRTN
jgi:hypothetical protein